MKSILITGASGFIGEELLKSKWLKPYNVDLLLHQSVPAVIPKNCNCVTLDVLNKRFRYDIVIHMASYLTPSCKKADLEKLIESNISFGAKLIDAISFSENSIFIDFGTLDEKNFSPNRDGVSYLYAATKLAFKELAAFYSNSKSFNYLRLIPYSVYSDTLQDKKIIDLIAKSAFSTNPVAVTNGEQVLDFTHRKDVVRIIKKIVEQKDYSKLNKLELDVCTGRGTSVRNLADMFSGFGLTPNLAWGDKAYREADIMYAVGDPRPAREYLDFSSVYSLEETIEVIIKNLRIKYSFT